MGGTGIAFGPACSAHRSLGFRHMGLELGGLLHGVFDGSGQLVAIAFHIVSRQQVIALGGGLGQFAVEAGNPVLVLVDGAQDGVAAGGKFGEAGSGFIGCFLRPGQSVRCSLQRHGGFRANVVIGTLTGLQRLTLLGEAGEDAVGVVQQFLLALQIRIDLGNALVELLAAFAGTALFFIKNVALMADALQHRGAHGFLLAQGRQLLAQVVAQTQPLGGSARVLGQHAGCLVEGRGVALRGFRRLAPVDIEAHGLQPADLARKALVLRRLTRLALQAVQLGLELRGDVVEAGEVGFRRLELQLRLMAARVQPRDARRLFEDQAPGLRLRIDDLGDLALPHEGGRARAGRGIGEQQLHVTRTHVLAVDAVGGALVALDAARDFEKFLVLVMGWCRAVVIGERDHDFRHVAGRALGGAGEDHVVHAGRAHRLVGAFAHHPAQGFEQVRLAAAVGADDAGEAGLDQKVGRLNEGFESRKPQPCKLHLEPLAPSCQRPAPQSCLSISALRAS